jgi:DNA repair photolyase
MPKYEGLCPTNFEIDVYQKCHYNCIYCISKTNPDKNSYISSDLDDIKKRLLYENKRRHPVYLSPWTDPYPPSEEKEKSTEKILTFLSEKSFPYFVITKGNLILRDKKLFKAENTFAAISLNTLDDDIVKTLEPDLPSATERKELIEKLVKSGVRTVVKIDPIIPGITDEGRLRDLTKWLCELKPTAVTIETLRINKILERDVKKAIPEELFANFLPKYEEITDQPKHPNLEYRLSLFRNLAKLFEENGVKASFCKASLSYSITPHDCRGGF